MDPQLIELMLKYPQISAGLSALMVCRLIMKPICAIYIQYVKDTPEQDDDNRLAAFLANPKMKAVLFVLDMLFSIKLPSKASDDKQA